MNTIELINVSKQYGEKEAAVFALKNVSLTIEGGEIVVVLGPSGSGKSTLLHILGALDRVTEGIVKIDNEDITHLTDAQLTKIRRDRIGFVFQDYGLLPNLTMFQNIELGARLSDNAFDIEELIKTIELEGQENKFPGQMSGGEQQRVSIARALAKKPEVLLCDEPTGSLDEETGKKALMVLQRINKEYGAALVIVTHNPGIAMIANRIIRLNSGRVIEIVKNNEIMDASYIRWV